MYINDLQVLECYRNEDFVDEDIAADCQVKSNKSIVFVVTDISEGWAADEQQNVRLQDYDCT